jgi:hypothetical protein
LRWVRARIPIDQRDSGTADAGGSLLGGLEVVGSGTVLIGCWSRLGSTTIADHAKTAVLQ